MDLSFLRLFCPGQLQSKKAGHFLGKHPFRKKEGEKIMKRQKKILSQFFPLLPSFFSFPPAGILLNTSRPEYVSFFTLLYESVGVPIKKIHIGGSICKKSERIDLRRLQFSTVAISYAKNTTIYALLRRNFAKFHAYFFLPTYAWFFPLFSNTNF